MGPTGRQAPMGERVLVLTKDAVVADDIADVIRSAFAGYAVQICESVEQGVEAKPDPGGVAGAVVAGTLPRTEREQFYASMLHEGSWLIQIDGETPRALPDGVACTVLPRPFNTEMLVSALHAVTTRAPAERGA